MKHANKAMLETAMSQLGTKEIVGDEHEPEVLKYYADVGHGWVKDDETPWCAAFISWVCKHSLVPMPELKQRLRARGFMTWGKEVKRNARRGDVVVLWRGNPNGATGHVGLLIGYSKDRSKVYLLGGNQSNQVNITAYDSARIIAIRRGEHIDDIEFATNIDE